MCLNLNLQFQFPIVMMYRNFDTCFNNLQKLGEGSYGKVYLCQQKVFPSGYQTGLLNQNLQPNTFHQKGNQPQKNTKIKQYYALKKLKRIQKHAYGSYQNEQKQSSVEDISEVKLMRLFSHENLVNLNQIVFQDKGYKQNYFLVMPFGIQILQFAKKKQILLTKSLRKLIIYQIVKGVKQLHAQRVIHRDIKPDNIFVLKNGTVKIGDFSLSRKMPQNLKSEMEQQNQGPTCPQSTKLSGNVTTRYYRAPQIMYGSRHYDYKIDIWSLGCTIAELILHQPIFPGLTDINQLELIFKTLGYPQQLWPSASELPYYLEFTKQKQEIKLVNILPDVQPQLLHLIELCLQLDPQKRPSVFQLSSHIYFQDVEEKSQELEKLARYLHEKKLNEYLNKKN